MQVDTRSQMLGFGRGVRNNSFEVINMLEIKNAMNVLKNGKWLRYIK